VAPFERGWEGGQAVANDDADTEGQATLAPGPMPQGTLQAESPEDSWIVYVASINIYECQEHVFAIHPSDDRDRNCGAT
jgi:hypothetical protein